LLRASSPQTDVRQPHVADVDTYPKLDAAIGRNAGFTFSHAALDIDSTADLHRFCDQRWSHLARRGIVPSR
jgi:hypothetical protein